MRHTMVTYTVKPFWWTEVHRYGLEVAEGLEGIPLIRVRSKELLGGEPSAIARLLEFMGLDWREEWLARANRVVDRWHHTLTPGPTHFRYSSIPWRCRRRSISATRSRSSTERRSKRVTVGPSTLASTGLGASRKSTG